MPFEQPILVFLKTVATTFASRVGELKRVMSVPTQTPSQLGKNIKMFVLLFKMFNTLECKKSFAPPPLVR